MDQGAAGQTEKSVASGSVRVLVIASPNGHFKELFAKVQAIQTKYGQFGALFVTGNLFAPTGQGEDARLNQEAEDVLAGKLACPIPTYFYHPQTALPQAVQDALQTASVESPPSNSDVGTVQIAKNLVYLGHTGIVLLENGLRVAFCGGAWSSSAWSSSTASDGDMADKQSPSVTRAAISKLLSHPSFALPPERNQSNESLASLNEPQTLAQARRAAASAVERAARVAEAESAEKARPPIDLLLLNYWPSWITLLSKADLPHPTARAWGCPPFADLVKRGKPRYIFAQGPSAWDREDRIVGLDDASGDTAATDRHHGFFWEREPYSNDDGSVTRFISLAQFGNPQKRKWFMALNVTAASAQTVAPTRPSNATESPYTSRRKPSKRNAETDNASSGPNFRWEDNNRTKRVRKEHDQDGKPPEGYSCHICGSGDHFIRQCPEKAQRQDVPPEGYVCNACGASDHYIRLCPKRAATSRGPRTAVTAVAPKDCWFCLSNPQCAKHLIVDIGEDCYVALPKGQVPSSADPDSPVPGGGHVLIVPVAHTPSLLLGSPQEAQTLSDEVERYRAAVRQTYQAYEACAFEWEVCMLSNTRAGHMQVQMVPVPLTMAKGLAEAFVSEAAEEGFEFLDGDQARQLLAIGKGVREYVRVDIDGKTFAMDLSGRRFNLQFPRVFITKRLGAPERADWRACAKSDEVEAAETSEFKEAFAEFSASATT